MFSTAILPPDRQQALARDISRHLRDDVLGFWVPRALDQEYGGYLTHFDRQGHLLSREKNTWLHARQLWMFSRIWQDLFPDKVYLQLAQAGRNWLVEHAYAGQGRWNYLLDAEGRVMQGTIGLYTDLFCLMGLCSWAQATGWQEDLPLIEETFQAAARHLADDHFPDLFPQQYQPGCACHGKYMIGLNAMACAAGVLGWDRCIPVIQLCLDRIFGSLADPDWLVIHELCGLDGSPVDTEEGHRINPGHIFECMWFVLSLPQNLVEPHRRALALRILRATADRSLDSKWGGVLHMLDDEGKEGRYVDWNAERALRWDEKVWWTQSEALCALLFHARETGDPHSMKQFLTLYDWCKQHFWDQEYGEWYAVLHRNGTPRLCDKGGLQKSAFHIPRALYNCCLLLQGRPLFSEGGGT